MFTSTANIMRTNLLLACCLISAGLFAGCLPINCVKGTGNVAHKSLTVEAFHGIVLEGSLDVRLTRGGTQAVDVEAQANIAELVQTTVKDGIWRITTSKCYQTDKPFIVHITTAMIDHVQVLGSGDVTGTDAFDVEKAVIGVKGSGDVDLVFNARSVEASVMGSGNIKLGGSTGTIDCSVEGSGDVKASGMKATTANATMMGSGDIELQATARIDANVTGSGDVRYVGDPPEVHGNVTGSGEVEPMK